MENIFMATGVLLKGLLSPPFSFLLPLTLASLCDQGCRPQTVPLPLPLGELAENHS